MRYYGPFFLTLRTIFRVFIHPWCKLVNLPSEDKRPVVYVSRHQKFDGMFSVVGRLPSPVRVWVLDVLTEKKACQKHMLDYTMTQRFHFKGRLAKFLARGSGAFLARLMNSMHAIPVYRGKKEIVHTFRMSAEALAEGWSVLIFPDVEYTDESPEAGPMYPGFVNLARMARKNGVETVRFVPLYTSMRRHAIYAGDPVIFNPEVPFAGERDRIVKELQDSMNDMAEACGDKKAQK